MASLDRGATHAAWLPPAPPRARCRVPRECAHVPPTAGQDVRALEGLRRRVPHLHQEGPSGRPCPPARCRRRCRCARRGACDTLRRYGGLCGAPVPVRLRRHRAVPTSSSRSCSSARRIPSGELTPAGSFSLTASVQPVACSAGSYTASEGSATASSRDDGNDDDPAAAAMLGVAPPPPPRENEDAGSRHGGTTAIAKQPTLTFGGRSAPG